MRIFFPPPCTLTNNNSTPQQASTFHLIYFPSLCAAFQRAHPFPSAFLLVGECESCAHVPWKDDPAIKQNDESWLIHMLMKNTASATLSLTSSLRPDIVQISPPPRPTHADRKKRALESAELVGGSKGRCRWLVRRAAHRTQPYEKQALNWLLSIRPLKIKRQKQALMPVASVACI